ncbi:MAG: hypothetical protein HYZ38_21040 [Mycobacterium sp.]|nr:hypothetical protein [Mycobacterium sp.]
MKLELKALEYTYRIHWSPAQQGYVASVAEFPEIQSPPTATPAGAADAVATLVVQKLRRLDSEDRSMPLILAAEQAPL